MLVYRACEKKITNINALCGFLLLCLGILTHGCHLVNISSNGILKI